MFKCEAISPEDGSNACVVLQNENVGASNEMKPVQTNRFIYFHLTCLSIAEIFA